jgi:hypothetical protein
VLRFKITSCACTIAWLAALTVSESFANAATCPAFGADTDCGVIITITDTGATVSFTGQGPYDSIEDTLVGVVNNSKVPIRAIVITSGQPVFALDGDGIDTYGAPGNAMDTTRYGGPNSYFTGINTAQTSGTVNFVIPIPPGGSTYFSLEEAITAATACTTVINNALTGPNGAGTQTISASFTPKGGYTLAQAAQLCGFVDFDWQQTITSWSKPSPLFQVGKETALSAPPPFLDPPPGGYTYELTHGYPNGDHSYPFYYDPKTGELASHETATTLSFSDTPSDPCLPGGSGSGCGGKTAPKGSKLAFSTHLVGVTGTGPGYSATDTGISFSWTSTFNGTSGSTATTKNNLPPDPGSGTGGVTIVSVQPTSSLGGITIGGVNGGSNGGQPLPLLSGNSCNGSFGGTFKGNITVSGGQTCTFSNGMIDGNVTLKGGSLIITGTDITGNLDIQGGNFALGGFSAVEGSVEVQNLASSPVVSTFCDSTVYGDLQVHNNNAPVEIGNSSGCGGNVVGANLEVHNNAAAISVVGNTITGNLQIQNNTGPTQVSGNTL